MTDPLLVRWLRLAAERVAGARELLTDLDAAIGDGDHGINLDRGFAELVRRLDAGELPDAPPAATLELAGRAIMATVGGASGALYGRGLQRAGASLAATEPAAAAPATREEQAARALATAVEAITALGRARPGEKTMLDALVPARDAFHSAVSGGADLAGGGRGSRGRGRRGGRGDDPPPRDEGPGQLPGGALGGPSRSGSGVERAPPPRPRRRRGRLTRSPSPSSRI